MDEERPRSLPVDSTGNAQNAVVMPGPRPYVPVIPVYYPVPVPVNPVAPANPAAVRIDPLDLHRGASQSDAWSPQQLPSDSQQLPRSSENAVSSNTLPPRPGASAKTTRPGSPVSHKPAPIYPQAPPAKITRPGSPVSHKPAPIYPQAPPAKTTRPGSPVSHKPAPIYPQAPPAKTTRPSSPVASSGHAVTHSSGVTHHSSAVSHKPVSKAARPSSSLKKNK